MIIVGGGQSGLAAARAARDAGLRPVVLHAGTEPTGSWPDYYDSLTLFSPARYSALPGMPFDGDPDRYPRRDEVVAYLRRYADSLDIEVRTRTRAVAVHSRPGGGYVIRTDTDDELAGIGVVAATGSFGNPYLPALPGQSEYGGDLRHVADYRRPDAYDAKRVVVVGGGNSAVQVAYELTARARVTLATREPVRFLPQRIRGRDLHHWLHVTGADRLSRAVTTRLVGHATVLDTGRYRNAITSGELARRDMFTRFAPDGVVWSDGTHEAVDAVIFATGYRPDLDYLAPLATLDHGMPQQVGGISTTHPGLVHLGLEFQRTFASNTLRGVGRDAVHVMAALAARRPPRVFRQGRRMLAGHPRSTSPPAAGSSRGRKMR
ncbi:NAD(P)/FAD-dependent oxidoreductase [Micromonospora sp. PPF5-17]|uniref:NAD(P)/FAD-dependent oxidoreductase n=1 Tax=Micromonospora solifontis TaxID=2487138 RepID=A0ABX9WCC7_9ACTN|nr:NAD(P)/FAD-dependent oxidoreductase [Micromonospora solifontis]NES16285.1 NAD(P)/FAD-dependent oxidoreductase [Micromonospora sp. PPF5-17B]NES38345.1 NAD(P)/FAD-dependent oxidoreductase [Micromonospora solifontis]NES58097.1 NAD(P)/FAD-dependent oxidoreductase [Micromonospora sp. PPF5-6]RNL95877.1 NAD(P)/FAD-dependent oxidoreductase [Micromonospora solifontis]